MNKKENVHLISNLLRSLIDAEYKLTESFQLESLPEAKQYDGATFRLNNKKCVYRKGKVTADRPGAFLALWKRPHFSSESNKPISLTEEDIDYLFINVKEHTVMGQGNQKIEKPKVGVFIFPASLLIEKGIIASAKHKGKTGFRVFPPWSGNRGDVATKVFSESGKKTQTWQLPYFVEVYEDGSFDSSKFNQIFHTI